MARYEQTRSSVWQPFSMRFEPPPDAGALMVAAHEVFREHKDTEIFLATLPGGVLVGALPEVDAPNVDIYATAICRAVPGDQQVTAMLSVRDDNNEGIILMSIAGVTLDPTTQLPSQVAAWLTESWFQLAEGDLVVPSTMCVVLRGGIVQFGAGLSVAIKGDAATVATHAEALAVGIKTEFYYHLQAKEARLYSRRLP